MAAFICGLRRVPISHRDAGVAIGQRLRFTISYADGCESAI
ncbi:hypothetical protein SAJA_12620 [Salinisphaera japonica YTM-1]|uniref:Uncharacterized protein n=1 Tax=Salinisphaera japonica YTM-1 TaxID=1209778 RepID=A0A423PJ88_9GAMM|nr:hypothetical protein SAJA_12620 [Salinisphaera japonica YTM-1]